MAEHESRNTPRGATEKRRKRGERIPPGVRHEALRLLGDGWTPAQISAHLGISEGSARKLKKDASAAEPAPSVPDVADANGPSDAPAIQEQLAELTPEAGLALVRSQIQECQQLAKLAQEDRNYSAAASATRQITVLMPVMRQLMAQVSETSGDVVSIPRDKIDSEIQAIYARTQTLASVELCPRCGCEIRMAAVGAAREKEPKL